MAAAIDQPLCYVVDGDAGLFIKLTRVEDAFVGDALAFSGVEDRVGVFEPFGDIIRAENGDPARLRETIAAHHQAVTPRDRQNGCGAVRRRRNGHGIAAGFRMARQERYEMRLDPNRSHAWTTAAVGDAERLMQVDVTDIGTHVSGAREAYEGIEVGAIEIDLPAVVMSNGADLFDPLLEYAVRRWVGDHRRRQVLGVGLGLGAEIIEVDIALRIRRDHDDPEATHRRRSRIGAMCRRRDEADIAMPFASAPMIGADGEQPRVLALGP